MQVACHILAYNVDLFIDHVLQNCASHVDKIYITYSARPWGYTPSSRETHTNPTTLVRVKTAIMRLRQETGCNVPIEIIEGDWLTEEDTRNTVLHKAHFEGFDWLIIQDADEFYTEASWQMLLRTLLSNPSADCIRTSWYLFWKSSQLVIQHWSGSIKDNNVGFALRCLDTVQFVRARWPNAENVRLVDASCFHYGYVMSDVQMREKVTTWGHSHEFNAEAWLRTKWDNWTVSTKNLNPRHPWLWQRAIRFPNEQPPFAAHFDLPVDLDRVPRGRDDLRNAVWDMRANGWRVLKNTKRLLLNF